jgi:hypothetical protein
MTATECLLQISELTKQNLQILQVLNDSFYTKSNHLSAVVGDTTYTIPSYIALENKVNHLQDAFNNLVHAAKAGETWFNFDGNSKEVLVRGYQQAPSPVDLTPQTSFETEAKTLFKDMLTPQPYLNFDMSALPDDIHQVVVKKIVPYSLALKNQFYANCSDISTQGTVQLDWTDVVRILASADTGDFVSGTDYLEYDTIYDLPVRNCVRSGSYIVEKVVTDQITENLENVLTLSIHADTPLTRTSFDGRTIDNLQPGDELVTYDGSAKLKVRTINFNSGLLEVLVESGEYVNIIGSSDSSNPSDYSILKLYSSSETARELHIPLEEDQYVYITIAPLNPRLNLQSNWSTGLYCNVDNLTLKDTDTGFRKYYNDNVLNLGDALIELGTVSYPSITRYTEDQMATLTTAPATDDINLDVVQINKHLNDSDTVKNIRALYSQKKQYQADLSEVQSRIASLTESLAEISFDDMSGTRSAYTAQIAELQDQQNELTTSINKIIDNIATSANDATIPLESAKFRARGYLDVEAIAKRIAEAMPVIGSSELGIQEVTTSVESIRENILGIQCRYRYRNADIPQANVSVIGDKFLFTEWSTYNPPLRERSMVYSDGSYEITRDDVDSSGFKYSDNVPKFNQLDIPISQGENVELQVRIIWGFGYPFVTVASEWSDALTVEFPDELAQDVQVTTIIEENNSDIETNRFDTILSNKGITAHADDSIDDQDITYFHKPESISSGFYTSERRIIPLKDKLQDMSADIAELQDMIEGTGSDILSAKFIVDGAATTLLPDVNNVVQLPAWISVSESEDSVPTGSSYKKDSWVYSTGSLTLTNTTEHTVYLFSVFPGSRDITVDDRQHKIFPSDDFQINGANGSGVGIVWTADDTQTTIKSVAYKQRCNQIITFRRTNPYDGSPLGPLGASVYPNFSEYNASHDQATGTCNTNKPAGLFVYPMSPNQYGLCMDADAVNAKYRLAPGETIQFDCIIEYMLNNTKSSDAWTLGVMVRTSLYADPLYYQIQIVAKYNQSTSDLLNSAKTSIDSLTKYSVTVR